MEKIQEILDNEVEHEVEKRVNYDDIVVMQVYYPNCPPQVRRKILVFDGNAPEVGAERVLPHFGHETSPCARFNVDQQGWTSACWYALNLAKIKNLRKSLTF